VKKILVLAVALVLGLSGAAFAIQAEIPADTTAAIAKGGTQVTIGGELRFRGATYQNISDFNKNVTGGAGYGAGERMQYDERLRLNVEAKVSPNTIGFLQMEVAGSTSGGENSNWGVYDSAGNTYGSVKQGEQKTEPIRLIQAWIQHSGSGLIGVPAYFKVGHQPITVGAGVFYKHNYFGDDAIVFGITPIKGLDITALTVKLAEGAINLKASDDTDLYSGIITYAINKNIVLGVDVSYLDLLSSNAITGASPYKGGLWNFGLNAKANISGFALYGSADFQAGSIKNVVAPDTKVYFRGMAFTAGASYKFAPVTLGLDFAYGSGDANGADNKNSTFMTSQAHTTTSPWVYNYLTNNAAGNLAGGLQNTMYVKLSATADVMKDVNVGGALILLEAAKKYYNNAAAGTMLTEVGAGNTFTGSSRYIGTEVDLNATYQIDKGLKYFVEGGYLFAGNYWKGATNISKPSDPWGIRHGIQLNF